MNSLCAIVHRNSKAPTSSVPDVSPLVSPCHRATSAGSFSAQRCGTGEQARKNRFLVINGRPGLESVSFLTEDRALS